MSRPLVARLSPELVGQRVVVRRRLPGGRFADVLGELLSWDDQAGQLRVRTRSGVVAVPLAEVFAGKQVPPAPERRRPGGPSIGVAELEWIAAQGWRPLELDWLGEPGAGWQLRAAEGFTGRANSALACGDPGLAVSEAIAFVRTWYRERGLRAQICVPEPLAQDLPLVHELAAAGWAHHNPTLVAIAAWRSVAAELARMSLPAGFSADSAAEPDQQWLDGYRYRGQELPPVARTLLLSAPAQVFVSVRHSGQTVAVGRAAGAQGWAGVTAMEVAPEYRRRGLARVVLAELASWALAGGYGRAYLQVAEPNSRARNLYASVGFTDHHRYHYRLAPPG